jgi:hypothetical protein
MPGGIPNTITADSTRPRVPGSDPPGMDCSGSVSKISRIAHRCAHRLRRRLGIASLDQDFRHVAPPPLLVNHRIVPKPPLESSGSEGLALRYARPIATIMKLPNSYRMLGSIVVSELGRGWARRAGRWVGGRCNLKARFCCRFAADVAARNIGLNVILQACRQPARPRGVFRLGTRAIEVECIKGDFKPVHYPIVLG